MQRRSLCLIQAVNPGVFADRHWASPHGTASSGNWVMKHCGSHKGQKSLAWLGCRCHCICAYGVIYPAYLCEQPSQRFSRPDCPQQREGEKLSQSLTANSLRISVGLFGNSSSRGNGLGWELCLNYPGTCFSSSHSLSPGETHTRSIGLMVETPITMC